MYETELILEIIMNGIPEGLMVINSNYRLEYASPLISQLIGLQEEEMHNKFCYQILRQREDPCEGMTYRCPLREVIESGKPLKSFQSYLSAKEEEVPFTIDYYPLKDESGKVIKIIGVLKNLDELNKMKSELGRLYRFAAMGELFQGLAHNLNTPLSAVMARGEMLGERLRKLKDDGGGEKKEKEGSFESRLDKNLRDAEVIVANAMKISEIIRNMMQKGLQEGEESPQMLNLSCLLKEELQFLESDMKFKHEIKKSYFLEDSIPYIKGVYFHFSQSFTNIISNAMESIDQSEVKELTVTSKYDENNIYIEIHDTGLGAKKIAKGHQPLTPREMRLTQTYELLKPYGAELNFKSKSHDNLYTIRIPYKRAEETAE
jgi:nitrogen-specific signal transduction histidine kinase